MGPASGCYLTAPTAQKKKRTASGLKTIEKK